VLVGWTVAGVRAKSAELVRPKMKKVDQVSFSWKYSDGIAVDSVDHVPQEFAAFQGLS
jgi:hypothetical protein